MLNFTVAATSFTFIDKSKFIKMRFLISTLAAAIAILSVVQAAPPTDPQADTKSELHNPVQDLDVQAIVGSISRVADKLKTDQGGQNAGGR